MSVLYLLNGIMFFKARIPIIDDEHQIMIIAPLTGGIYVHPHSKESPQVLWEFWIPFWELTDPMEEENHRDPATFKWDFLVPWRLRPINWLFLSICPCPSMTSPPPQNLALLEGAASTPNVAQQGPWTTTWKRSDRKVSSCCWRSWWMMQMWEEFVEFIPPGSVTARPWKYTIPKGE